MDALYITSTLETCKVVRGEREARLLTRIITTLGDGGNILVQCAFEAGRRWQNDHPTASVEFPDYNPPNPEAATDAGLRRAIAALIGECDYRIERARTAARGDVMSELGARETENGFAILKTRLQAMKSDNQRYTSETQS